MAVDDRLSPPTEGERRWLEVRAYLRDHRYELGTAAAGLYPAEKRVAGTSLLANPRWLPGAPLDLAAVDLRFDPCRPADGLSGTEPVSATVRPRRGDGSRYDAYSAAVAALAPPAVFTNLPTYRLLDADLACGRGGLLFGRGHYFDGLDVGEACAHEYAAHTLDAGAQPFRAAVGDPWNLASRPVNLAISTLTLRCGRSTENATLLLHRRDAAKVGHAGGLYQVVPVGVFQPSGPGALHERNDFDLWRSMVREFAEELRGEPEIHGDADTPLDYDAWPFAAQLTRARRERRVRVFVLGLGTDPLTFATDLLTVAVFDAPTFDELLGAHVTDNDEGRVVSALDGARGPGIPFHQDTIERLVNREPMQAAGAALLALAWRHRDVLLR